MPWVIFAASILLILGLDLFLFGDREKGLSFKHAAILSSIGIAIALLFNAYVYWNMGKEAGVLFLTGYTIEKILSIDNLFVFLLIFKYFQTPAGSMHPVLFWGILGAIVFRVIFVLIGLVAVKYFHPIIYLFGLFLIYSGIKFGFQKQQEIHPEKNPLIRFFHKIFPMTPDYVGDRFWVVEKGRTLLTPLAFVLLAIESSDILFAVDSIPAILAITYDPFLVITSNIFAVLNLRALFFLLSKSLDLFQYLHYGICAILIFVGFKMLVSDFLNISAFVSLGIIFGIPLLTILASILIKKEQKPKDS